MGTLTDVRSRAPVPDREHRAVAEHLDRWESASLLSHEQADALREYERAEAAAPGRRIPLVTEVVGYVGVALVAAAAASLASRVWDEWSSTVQLTILAVGTLVFLAVGWPVHRSEEPALARLAGVLWTVSVAGAFGFMLTLLFTRAEVDEPAAWAVFALGTVVGVYARTLLVMRSSALLQLALFAATMAAVMGLGSWAIDEGWDWLDRNQAYAVAGVTLTIAALWAAAGRAGVLEPRATAYVVAALAAIWTPIPITDESVGIAVLYGIVVSGVVLAAAVWLKSVPALGIGAFGLFSYVTWSSVHFLRDTAGTPIALLLAGLLLVVAAVLATRLRRSAAAPGPGSAPPSRGE